MTNVKVSSLSASERQRERPVEHAVENRLGLLYTTTSQDRINRVPAQKNKYVEGKFHIPDGKEKEAFHQTFIAELVTDILAGDGMSSPLVDSSAKPLLWGSNHKIDFVVKPKNETYASFANLVTFIEVKKDVAAQRKEVLDHCMNRVGKILTCQPQRQRVIFLALDARKAILGTATLKAAAGKVELALVYEEGQIW